MSQIALQTWELIVTVQKRGTSSTLTYFLQEAET